MAVALLVSGVFTLALVGLLTWLVIAKVWPVVFFVVLYALVGALTARRRLREPLLEREIARVEPARDRLETVVERLALVADVPQPRAEIDHRHAPQAWTVWGPRRGNRVIATTGLVELLDDDELAAVVAHELSHLANGDAAVMTVVGGPSTWILQGIRRAWADAGEIREYLAVVLYGSYSALLAIPGLLAARIVSRHRELAADRGAAILTGSPTALSTALRRLTGELDQIPKKDLRKLGGGDLFYVLPSRGEPRGLRRLWATHPRLSRRVRRLDEMERSLQAARPAL